MHDPTATVYVGTRTTPQRNGRGRGLEVWRAGTIDEPWTLLQQVEAVNPSFLAPSPDGSCLYAVHGDGDTLSAFGIDAGDGRLRRLATVPSGGRNPVFPAVAGQRLLVANYASGNVATLILDGEGDPGPVDHVLDLPGDPGPHPVQQRSSHPHQVLIGDDCFAIVPDKGLDRIFVLDLRDAQPRIASATPTRAGAGPRHAAVHPGGHRLYVVEELACALSVYRLQRTETLPLIVEELAHLSTVPTTTNISDEVTAAGIVLSADARSLYVTTRGDDSIACFSLDQDGDVTLTEIVPAGVGGPRFITLAPGAQHLLVAGETSHEIAALPIDAATGLLGKPQVVAHVGSPVSLVCTPNGATPNVTTWGGAR